ncbi:hypothetical protein BpHYR1_008157 [Brachionus plicatilis]|uniref:Uncharacterized protein n=1 Tax=Brachionus plicatilis TaxID=10195 RepID=A0A3M7PR49_BRAPC|nr:hypothetical protein BpHYR1_008157 [Brachionus plicatilis]
MIRSGLGFSISVARTVPIKVLGRIESRTLNVSSLPLTNLGGLLFTGITRMRIWARETPRLVRSSNGSEVLRPVPKTHSRPEAPSLSKTLIFCKIAPRVCSPSLTSIKLSLCLSKRMSGGLSFMLLIMMVKFIRSERDVLDGAPMIKVRAGQNYSTF